MYLFKIIIILQLAQAVGIDQLNYCIYYLLKCMNLKLWIIIIYNPHEL